VVVEPHPEIFGRSDMIVKVKEPLPSEYGLLKNGQILFTYLHLAANKTLTEALMKTWATCIADETVEVNHRLPLLEPMSEIAGRMSVLVGGFLSGESTMGKGCCSEAFPACCPARRWSSAAERPASTRPGWPPGSGRM